MRHPPDPPTKITVLCRSLPFVTPSSCPAPISASQATLLGRDDMLVAALPLLFALQSNSSRSEGLVRTTARNRSSLLPSLAVAVISAITLCACSHNKIQGASAGSPQFSKSIRFEYAVYLLPNHTIRPDAVAREFLAKRYPALKLVDQVPDDPASTFVSVRIQGDVSRKYAPPSLESLSYFGHGLSSEQARALRKSDEAIILQFAHPAAEVWSALYAANNLIEGLARQTGGLIWDEATREVFSAEAWHTRRLASWPDAKSVPLVSAQTAIHVYPNDSMLRAITLGMVKMGLPDVVVEDVPRSSENQVGDILNLFSQALAEGTAAHVGSQFKLDLSSIKNGAARDPQLHSMKRNAKGFGILSLAAGRHDEGDPDNRLIEIRFDAYKGNDSYAKQDRMLSCFFGAEDSVKTIDHTEELLAASRKARESLPNLRKTFNDGIAPGESILLKAPFSKPDGGHEWMWVEVTRWHGNRIQGLLQNDPVEVRDLHAGQMVDVHEEDIFDFIHVFPDKRVEGNTTGEIIQKMDEEPDAPARSSSPQPDCATN